MGLMKPASQRGVPEPPRAASLSKGPIARNLADVPTGQGGSVASWPQQPAAGRTWSKETGMSVYRVTEIIGTSSTSWEDAASEAIKTAAGTLRDLRVAEVVKQDIHLDEDGAIWTTPSFLEAVTSGKVGIHAITEAAPR